VNPWRLQCRNRDWPRLGGKFLCQPWLQVEASGSLDALLTDEFWLVIGKPEFAADGQPVNHEVEDIVE
jgi:hypothetical protein